MTHDTRDYCGVERGVHPLSTLKLVVLFHIMTTIKAGKNVIFYVKMLT